MRPRKSNGYGSKSVETKRKNFENQKKIAIMVTSIFKVTCVQKFFYLIKVFVCLQ